MPTRTLIGLFTVAAAVLGGYDRNLAAMMIALFGGGIIYLLHTIEFKLNRLLDDRGIRVEDRDIGSD